MKFLYATLFTCTLFSSIAAHGLNDHIDHRGREKTKAIFTLMSIVAKSPHFFSLMKLIIKHPHLFEIIQRIKAGQLVTEDDLYSALQRSTRRDPDARQSSGDSRTSIDDRAHTEKNRIQALKDGMFAQHHFANEDGLKRDLAKVSISRARTAEPFTKDMNTLTHAASWKTGQHNDPREQNHSLQSNTTNGVQQNLTQPGFFLSKHSSGKQ